MLLARIEAAGTPVPVERGGLPATITCSYLRGLEARGAPGVVAVGVEGLMGNSTGDGDEPRVHPGEDVRGRHATTKLAEGRTLVQK